MPTEEEGMDVGRRGLGQGSPDARGDGEQLGERLARRDESALEEAYAAYGPSVRAYLRRYVGPDQADDVLQRTFLDVWRSAGRYDPSQRFTGWLFTIAHRRAVDTLRAPSHSVVDVDALRELMGEDGRDTVDRYTDAAEVRHAMARLPEHEQETLRLAYFEDLTQAEIAQVTNVPIGTVKARSSRGLRRLAEYLRAMEEVAARG
jgi:RNA polymerase sigma-70 factor (ECF subfamily)